MDKRAVIKIGLVIISCALIAFVLFILMLQIPKVKAGGELQIMKEDCKTKGCFEGSESLNITYQLIEIGDRKYTPFCIFDKDSVEENAYLEYFTTWEEDVPDYECADTDKINETSGEYIKECTQTGSHKETKEGWLKFEGEKILAKKSDIYLSVTSGNCHLPFKLEYDGTLSPSDIALDRSLITLYFNFAPDEKAVDVVPSIKIGTSSFNMSKMAWWNQTDGWSVTKAGSGVSNYYNGITTNGSDWWFVDRQRKFVNHLDANLNNISDGFSTVPSGCGDPAGLFYNGSALIAIDDGDENLCVMSLTGSALGGNGISISAIVAPSNGFWSNSIWGNGSDLWFSEGHNSGQIFHISSTFQNMSDGFPTGSKGCTNPTGGLFNNSDFYVACYDDDFIYHFDKNGNNVSDGFSVGVAGSNMATDLVAYPHTDYTTPLVYTDFWVTDTDDNFVFHFNQPAGDSAANESQGDDAILQGIANSTINSSYTTYSGKQVYMRNVTGQQKLGRFDVVASSGNQRWAFNYISSSESTSNFTYMVNITPSLYVWEATNLTYSQIRQQVTALINSTNSTI